MSRFCYNTSFFRLIKNCLHVIIGIEAADLTSLLEQFEETQGNHSLVQLYFLEVQVRRFFNLKLCWCHVGLLVISEVTVNAQQGIEKTKCSQRGSAPPF